MSDVIINIKLHLWDADAVLRSIAITTLQIKDPKFKQSLTDIYNDVRTQIEEQDPRYK